MMEMTQLIFRHYFETDKMRSVFDDSNYIKTYLEGFKAIAKAEADLGLIPREAAEEISRKASLDYIKVERVAKLHEETGAIAVAVYEALAEVCEYGAGEYIGFGVSGIDLLEIQKSLQVREALNVLIEDLKELESILLELTEKYADTVIVGRTFGQHGLPITLGFKFAIWTKEIRNSLEDLKERIKDISVFKLSGTHGSLAPLGAEMGQKLRETVAKYLGLQLPDITIQTSRARYAKLLNSLAIIATTLDVMAQEIFTRQRTEIGELKIAAFGRSTTSPHKHNPYDCNTISGLAEICRGNASIIMHTKLQDERDWSFISIETHTIPETFLILSAMINFAKKILRGLRVNNGRMKKNLELEKGLIMSEIVMHVLAKKGIGRHSAHRLMQELADRTYETGKSFKEVLLENEKIRKLLSKEEIDNLLDPRNALGIIPKQIEETIKAVKNAQGENNKSLCAYEKAT